MKYRVVLFGVKDTSREMIGYLHKNVAPIDLIVTIAPKVTEKNQISGYQGLQGYAAGLGIPVYEAESYYLSDDHTRAFFGSNEFGIGVVVGWQRLIPKQVLDRFEAGVFGFHGNSGYLPFGRGRSPLNWTILLGDTRFNLNLFRYDEKADSPNVFRTEMFSITPHDDIRTAQYKQIICMKRMTKVLLETYIRDGSVPVKTDSKDPDSWYDKRTPEDGKLDFHDRTRNLYNLIRAVARPFPGAFCFAGDEKVVVWAARPFDEVIDFSAYAPGEVVEVFENRAVVRTIDGSLLIDEYESGIRLEPGMILS